MLCFIYTEFSASKPIAANLQRQRLPISDSEKQYHSKDSYK